MVQQHSVLSGVMFYQYSVISVPDEFLKMLYVLSAEYDLGFRKKCS
jgi:hypothetical protein